MFQFYGHHHPYNDAPGNKMYNLMHSDTIIVIISLILMILLGLVFRYHSSSLHISNPSSSLCSVYITSTLQSHCVDFRYPSSSLCRFQVSLKLIVNISGIPQAHCVHFRYHSSSLCTFQVSFKLTV